MSDHAYVSSKHCETCAAEYMRRWRARSGGKPAARTRSSKRARMVAVAAANPERYRPVRGVVVDLEDGIAYGRRWEPLGWTNRDGYVVVDRRCLDDGRATSVHRLVWEAMHGPIPEGMEINHLNGVKDDNRITNLEMVTRPENLQHAYQLGLASNRGERHPSSRLTERSVRSIRAAAALGIHPDELASIHDVSRRCIKDVISGRTWSHLQEVEA